MIIIIDPEFWLVDAATKTKLAEMESANSVAALVEILLGANVEAAV